MTQSTDAVSDARSFARHLWTKDTPEHPTETQILLRKGHVQDPLLDLNSAIRQKEKLWNQEINWSDFPLNVQCPGWYMKRKTSFEISPYEIVKQQGQKRNKATNTAISLV